MMNITSCEEIQNRLLEVPAIIQCFERREPGFIERGKEWLASVEQVLTNNRMAAAATIAILHGMTLNAERGILPEWLKLKGRGASRKAKEAVAMEALRQAEEILAGLIKGPAAQFTEGERLARQLVVMARRKALIPAERKLGHPEYLKEIWQALSNDPDLGAVTMHLQGAVEYNNALILLERALTGVENEQRLRP